MDLREYVRDIPDFPTEGILFRDISPMLSDPAAFAHVVDTLTERYSQRRVDSVVAIDARGFVFGAPVAYRLGKPLVLVRKQGKLPYETIRTEYTLEYGANVVEMHTDAVAHGDSVLIVDDLLATGGTLAAAARLVELAGGRVEEVALVLELEELDGRKRLRGYDVFSLLRC